MGVVRLDEALKHRWRECVMLSDNKLQNQVSDHPALPYLAEPISIDALTLADPWPFVIVALGSAILVFQFREHTNAIILSWMALRATNPSAHQLLNVRPNCRTAALAAGLHVASRELTAHRIRCCEFVTIDVCRSAIAHAALSGGSSPESQRSLFLRITGSTATTELQL
jgi:hypothetical protein